eukprot:2516094-Amphidinium_carterae.1
MFALCPKQVDVEVGFNGVVEPIEIDIESENSDFQEGDSGHSDTRSRNIMSVLCCQLAIYMPM